MAAEILLGRETVATRSRPNPGTHGPFTNLQVALFSLWDRKQHGASVAEIAEDTGLREENLQTPLRRACEREKAWIVREREGREFRYRLSKSGDEKVRFFLGERKYTMTGESDKMTLAELQKVEAERRDGPVFVTTLIKSISPDLSLATKGKEQKVHGPTHGKRFAKRRQKGRVRPMARSTRERAKRARRRSTLQASRRTPLESPLPRRILTGIRVIQGETALRKTFTQMKEASATFYYAIWTGEYGPLEDYFRNEVKALRKKRSNVGFYARRLVSRKKVQQNTYDEHRRILANEIEWGLYEARRTDTELFEMMVADYDWGKGKREQKLLLVDLDPLTFRPVVGLLLDSKIGYLRGLVRAFTDDVFKLSWAAARSESENGSLWNSEKTVASYFKYVDEEPGPVLKRYEEWEKKQLDDFLATLTYRYDVALCEVGSGTGRLLLRYLDQGMGVATPPLQLEPDSAAARLTTLVGIDNSEEMLGRSKEKLDAMLRESSVVASAKRPPKVIHIHADARKDLSEYVVGGRLNREKLDELGTDAREADDFDQSAKVICCMLNTLGIVEGASARRAILSSMKDAAGPKGHLFLSVLNGVGFLKHYKSIYEPLQELVGREHEWAVDKEAHVFRSKQSGYYSHWFEPQEIERLVRQAGYTNVTSSSLEDLGTVITAETK